MKFFTSPKFAYLLLGLIIICAVGFVVLRYHPISFKVKKAPVAAAKVDPDVAFTDEVYSTIQNNYWNKISDADLSNIYLLAAQKIASSTSITLSSKDLAGVGQVITQATESGTSTENKANITATINEIVLANLQPFGRSALYTQALTQNLNNEVNNISPQINLYSYLGLTSSSTVDQVNQAYKQQSAKLEGVNTAAAKQQLANINRAEAALGTTANKQVYDSSGAEPSVTGQLVSPTVLYTDFVRFSPTMLQDFDNILKSYQNTPNLDSLIIDLRGDIGGDIDLTPYLTGAFLGSGQYAYELYHQGTSTPVQTTLQALPELSQYKKIVVLVDGQTQSSAELFASVLKKYHIGVLVGTKTRGWGTIESVFDLKNQIDPSQHYSVFLVHTLTLRDDNQPVEGNGVIPNVDISDKNWQAELDSYYNYPPLTQAVSQLESQ